MAWNSGYTVNHALTSNFAVNYTAIALGTRNTVKTFAFMEASSIF